MAVRCLAWMAAAAEPDACRGELAARLVSAGDYSFLFTRANRRRTVRRTASFSLGRLSTNIARHGTDALPVMAAPHRQYSEGLHRFGLACKSDAPRRSYQVRRWVAKGRHCEARFAFHAGFVCIDEGIISA